jgi:hypothetical protein
VPGFLSRLPPSPLSGLDVILPQCRRGRSRLVFSPELACKIFVFFGRLAYLKCEPGKHRQSGSTSLSHASLQLPSAVSYIPYCMRCYRLQCLRRYNCFNVRFRDRRRSVFLLYHYYNNQALRIYYSRGCR